MAGHEEGSSTGMRGNCGQKDKDITRNGFHTIKGTNQKHKKYILNISQTRAAKAEAQKRYTQANKKVRKSARKDKRMFVENLHQLTPLLFLSYTNSCISSYPSDIADAARTHPGRFHSVLRKFMPACQHQKNFRNVHQF